MNTGTVIMSESEVRAFLAERTGTYMHEFIHDYRRYRFDALRKAVQEHVDGEWVDVLDPVLLAALLRVLNDGYGPDGD